MSLQGLAGMTGKRGANLSSLSLYSRTKHHEGKKDEDNLNRGRESREGKSREEETLEMLYKKV